MPKYYEIDSDEPYSDPCPYNFKGYMTVGESKKTPSNSCTKWLERAGYQ